MPRRSNGEGTIYRRQDGRWTASLQLDGKRSTLYGKSRGEVSDKLRALQNLARQNGTIPSGGRMTVADYLKKWLEQAEARLRPTTLDAYRTIIHNYLVPRIGQLKLTKLDPLRIANLYAQLAKEGYSKRRIESIHQLFHKALSDAQKWGMIPINPASPIDAPKRETREVQLWNYDQIQLFLESMSQGQGGTYGNLFMFLLASGCRIGEALGLGWTNVDWVKGTVKIDRQIITVRGKCVEGPPKTKAGIRTITLPNWGLEALQRQRTQARGVRVFTTEMGTIPDRRNVSRALHAACSRLDLPLIRVHTLRHLCLSLMAMHGVPVRVAQQRAGHSSPVITMKVYQHVIGDSDKQASMALEQAVILRPRK